ncbi:MAG: hypothetical protein AAF497_21890 [Planctomycetota bacterium]
MGFIPPWLSQLIGDSQFNACVERNIRDIEDNVWNQVAELLPTMSQDEARGYIRARSTMVINQRLDVEPHAVKYPRYRARLFDSIQDKIIVAMNARAFESTGLNAIPVNVVRRAA